MTCPNSNQFHFSRGCSFFAKGECTSTCSLRFFRTIYRLLRIIVLARRYLRLEEEVSRLEAKMTPFDSSDEWFRLYSKKCFTYKKLITEMRDNHIDF